MNLQYKYVNYHPKYPNLWMTLVNNISTIPVAPSVPADGKCGLFLRSEIQFGGLGSLQFPPCLYMTYPVCANACDCSNNPWLSLIMEI